MHKYLLCRVSLRVAVAAPGKMYVKGAEAEESPLMASNTREHPRGMQTVHQSNIFTLKMTFDRVEVSVSQPLCQITHNANFYKMLL